MKDKVPNPDRRGRAAQLNGLLVDTNWNAHICGYEIEPLKLRDEIVAARLGAN